MHYEVEVNGRLRTVDVTRTGDGFAVEVDGHPRNVDAKRIDAQTLSLLIGDMRPEGDSRPDLRGRSASYEVAISHPLASGPLRVHVGTSPVAVTLNGRRRRKADGSHGGGLRGVHGGARGEEDGLQRVVAPMPGKVMRVLVAAGDAVKARQPLVVVEAMKMENEVRAVRDGHVAAIHVREGASVDAGALLIELKS
jgi:acetyl/propionyl-CoA carboxylase alpha subunit